MTTELLPAAAPLVAVLVDRYEGEQRALADGVANAVRRTGHGVLCVSGRELAGDYRKDREAWTWNAIYRLVERVGVGGVICLSEGIGRDVDADRLHAFLARFGTPVIAVGAARPGAARSLVDVTGAVLDARAGLAAGGADPLDPGCAIDASAALAARLLLERIGAASGSASGDASGSTIGRAEPVRACAPYQGARTLHSRELEAAGRDFQLAIGAATDMPALLGATERWLGAANVKRCFLVRHEWPYPTPYKAGELLLRWCDGVSGDVSAETFPTRRLLPDTCRRELARGQLVLVPICVDLDHYGYLLVDPGGLEEPALESIAQCLAGALRAQHLIASLKDQAEMLRRSNGDLQRSANHDPLTGLPNRLRFQECLRRLCESGEEGAEATLLFIDLDGFKLVNDTLGHDAGDQLLREVARRLEDVTEGVRAIGGLVARLGGDEFVILMTHAENHDISVDARAILTALAEPYTLGDEEIIVSASIGGARFPDDSTDAARLLKQADRAMYQAKHGGKNGIAFYSHDLGIADGETLRLLQDMRTALPRGDLRMHYQPRVELASGRIVGAEALMRWLVDSPGGPLVRASPGEFIPLAERTGFVTELDRFALEEGCRQARAWVDAGHPLVVSVNVSTNMLQQAGLVALVARTLERHALAPGLIELEITESGVMGDMDESVATLLALRALGVRLAIDDFGKGQSSLGYLARLPVDTLKIDSSFLEPMLDGGTPPASCTAIMRAIVALGRGLDLSLVAEGVENEVQHAFVEAAGCEFVQGYLHGRPCSAEALSLLLEDAVPLRLAS